MLLYSNVATVLAPSNDILLKLSNASSAQFMQFTMDKGYFLNDADFFAPDILKFLDDEHEWQTQTSTV